MNMFRFRTRRSVAHTRGRWNTLPSPESSPDRGSAVVELVLLTPVLVVLLLMVVFAGRAGQAVEQVQHAADQGARAASMVHRRSMPAEARRAVDADLANNGSPCEQHRVSVQYQVLGSTLTVTVSVTCTIDRSGLGLLGAGSRTVVAYSTEVVDRYRAGGWSS
jgi:Flp pilus assembly protein TadG